MAAQRYRECRRGVIGENGNGEEINDGEREQGKLGNILSEPR